MKRLAWLLVLALALPGAARAQGLSQVEATFQEWVAANGVRSASLAVTFQDRLVLAKGLGGLDPRQPVPLASLSKAITAICVARLVDAGKLRFDTPVDEALADFFRRRGEPADARVKQATIGHFLSHRAGFDRNHGDPTTGPVLTDHLRGTSASDAAIEALLARTLRARLGEAPGSAYHYTNATYLTLGAVIEAASGQRYDEHCRASVLEPLGIKGAALDARWTVLSSFGGWRLTGAQYLRFLEAYAPRSRVLGPAARAFLEDGEGKWVNDQRQVYYALGMNARATPNGGRNFWHAGAWSYSINNNFNFQLSDNFGAYAVRFASQIAWFASYAPKPADAQINELDRAMARALGQVRDWPATNLYREFGVE